MKETEVPQHQGLFGHRKAVCYAVDETGDYRLLPTAGWEPVNLANRQAWEEIAAQLTGILDHPPLLDYSRRMTEIGDRWREFALLGARACKGRKTAAEACPELAVRPRECADLEESLFRELGKEVRRL